MLLMNRRIFKTIKDQKKLPLTVQGFMDAQANLQQSPSVAIELLLGLIIIVRGIR